MYKLFLLVIVLLLFAKSKSLRDYEIDCSNYESCDQCNKNDNCKFQEGRCIKSRMLDSYEEITDLRLYSFKNSKTLNKEGSFSIIHSDEINKEIYILGDGDSCLKTVCDWDLIKNYDSTYDIKIKRSCFVNEVINIVAIGTNGVKRFSNKELTSCTSENFEIRIKDLSQIKISVYSFNSSSRFEIFITQSIYEENDYRWVYLTLSTILLIMLFLVSINFK